jgi:hypothetical protein
MGGITSSSKRGIGRVLAVLALLLAVTAAGAGGQAAAAEKTPPGDPPGNNGTIKVKKADPSVDPEENNNANQPHIDGCVVWLSYSGFDQAQTADITFTAHPPSGTGEVLVADKSVPVSNDPAGGGQDQDVVIAYNLTAAVKNLEHQQNQGYHIKVASDTKEAPGGAKQKVFWIDCAPAEATTLTVTKAVQGTGPGPFPFELRCNHRILDTTFTLAAGESKDVAGVPAGTTCVVNETDAKGATKTDVTENPPDDKADGKTKVVGGTPATMTFTNVFGQVAATPAGNTSGTLTPTAVLGATETNTGPATLPTDLPRTGADPTPLVGAGLWSLSAGSLALVAARRLRRS